MADNLDPNLLRELNENFSLLNSSTGYQNKEFDSLTSSTRSLNTEFIKLIGITNSDLAKSLSQFNKNLDKSSKDTEKADKFAQTDLEKKKKQSKELETEHTRNLTYYKSLSGYATSLEGFVNQTSYALTKAAGNGLVFSTVIEASAIYAKNLVKVYEATIDAQNAYTKSLIGGQRGFALVARYNEQVGKAANDLQRQLGGLAVQVGSAVAVFSLVANINPLFRVLGIAAGGLAAMFGYNEQMAAKAADTTLEFATQLAELKDRITSTMYDLGAASVIGIEGITGFKKDLAKLTLPLSDAAKFSTILRNNVSELAIIGPTAAEGGRKLAEISGKLIESDLGEQFEYMGITVEKQTEHTLKYLSLQQRLGLAQEKDTTKLSMAAGKYLVELEKIAVLTGATREEQEKARDQVMAIEELRAAMLAEEDTEKKKQLERAVQASEALFAAGAKDAGAAIAKMAAAGGAITSQESAKLQMAAPKFVDDILNGKGPVTVALKGFAGEVQEFQKQFAGTGRLSYEAIKDILIMGFKDAADLKIKVDNSYAAAEKLAREKNYTLDKALFEIRKTQDEETKKAIDLERAQRKEAIAKQESLVVAQAKASGIFDLATNKFSKAVDDFVKSYKTPEESAGISGDQQADVKQSQAVGGLAGTKDQEDRRKLLPEITQHILKLKDYEKYYNEGMKLTDKQLKAMSMAQTEVGKQAIAKYQKGSEVTGNAGGGKGSDPLAGLNFGGKKEERTGGGEVNPALIAMAHKINDMFPGVIITALNDKFHQDRDSKSNKKSKHTIGKALDFSLAEPPKNAEEADAIKQQLIEMGAISVRDEYFKQKNDKTRGGHFHVEVAHDGGHFKGPVGSEFPVLIKSNETVLTEKMVKSVRGILNQVQKQSVSTVIPELNQTRDGNVVPNNSLSKNIQQLTDINRNIPVYYDAQLTQAAKENIKQLTDITDINKNIPVYYDAQLTQAAKENIKQLTDINRNIPVYYDVQLTQASKENIKQLTDTIKNIPIFYDNKLTQGTKDIQQLTDTIKNIPIFYDNKLTQGTKDIEPLFKSIENNVVPNIFDPIIKAFGIKTTELKQVDQEKEKTPITQQVIPSTNVTSNDSVVKDLISMLIKQQEQTMEKYNTMVELLESSARSQDQLLKYSM